MSLLVVNAKLEFTCFRAKTLTWLKTGKEWLCMKHRINIPGQGQVKKSHYESFCTVYSKQIRNLSNYSQLSPSNCNSFWSWYYSTCVGWILAAPVNATAIFAWCKLHRVGGGLFLETYFWTVPACSQLQCEQATSGAATPDPRNISRLMWTERAFVDI